MDLDKLKEPLGEATFAELSTYIADLTGQRDTARKESIDGRRTLKARVTELETQRSKLFERLGIDSDEDIDALPDAKGQAEAVKQFEAKMKRLEREAADKDKALQDLSAKHRGTVQQAALSRAMADHAFIDRDLVESYVGQRLAWEDDALLYRTEDGKLLDLAEGVKLLASTKPHLLKAQGAGGSGYAGSRGNGNGAKTMTRAEFQALPPDKQMAAIKEHATLTD